MSGRLCPKSEDHTHRYFKHSPGGFSIFLCDGGDDIWFDAPETGSGPELLITFEDPDDKYAAFGRASGTEDAVTVLSALTDFDFAAGVNLSPVTRTSISVRWQSTQLANKANSPPRRPSSKANREPWTSYLRRSLRRMANRPIGWQWDSRQRTERVHGGVLNQIWLDIEEPGLHTIIFSMREDGFEPDRFLLTKEKDAMESKSLDPSPPASPTS